jgi:hypothetical protein
LPKPTQEKFIGAYSVPPLSRLADNLLRLGKEKIFAGKDVRENSAASALRL